jgi:ergothioneine biosynthesis protein EgtB
MDGQGRSPKTPKYKSRLDRSGIDVGKLVGSDYLIIVLPIPLIMRASSENVAVNPEASLAERFRSVRRQTRLICEPLEREDYVIQSMEDVSPTKWHLAHTTWFFEVFVLKQFAPGYCLKDERYPFLFNSYYIQAGDRWSRPHRGILSRPTVEEVFAYRSHVDEAMDAFLARDVPDEARTVLEIGLHHEQQHQELMVTDIKHVLSVNPLYPTYHRHELRPGLPAPGLNMIPFEAAVTAIGYEGNGFSYDNEGPRHRQFVEAFELASRPITNGEFLAFIEDGGYARSPLWLSQGWELVQTENWGRPMYWLKQDHGWFEFTLYGLQPLDMQAPLSHVSYFEADAYARWKGCRLPTEFEWEHAAAGRAMAGQYSDERVFHAAWPGNSDGNTPVRSGDGDGSAIAELHTMFGTSWEWTSSHYSPYPGYKPVDGALGEYNGKFMANQFVLKGGSCATPSNHIRRTYRNFFPSDARWQFTGVRLARTI